MEDNTTRPTKDASLFACPKTQNTAEGIIDLTFGMAMNIVLGLLSFPFIFLRRHRTIKVQSILSTKIMSSIDLPDDGGPVKKKPKVTESSASPSSRKQSNLLSFFGNKTTASSDDVAKETVKNESHKIEKIQTSKQQVGSAPTFSSADRTAEDAGNATNPSSQQTDHCDHNNDDRVPDPMIPHQVASDPKAKWIIVKDCMLVRTVKDDEEEPRGKVAAFDVDGTLFVWRIAGWPSKYEHYELWSTKVVEKLRKLHDDGFKLVLVSNQGAIRGAFTGKKATFVQSLFEWLAKTVDRPIHAIMSTKSKGGYHKPNAGMWEIVEKHCNNGQAFDVQESFFVGDSVGEDDPQGGVDSKFAENVGALKGSTLKFFTPEDYFGPCDSEKRKKQGAMADYEVPPETALEARKALLGGYLQGPIVLLLSGVQGSGKSTFCNQLFVKQDQFGDLSDSDSDSENLRDHPWVHLSQDTINKGKPGKREQVEEETRKMIRNGRSVVIDRMHLVPEQRKHFVDIAKEMEVPVHVVVFQAPKEVIAKRVRERTDHPGGVQGEKGVKVAMMSLSKMVPPNYKEEGFDLITCVQHEESFKRLSGCYRRVQHKKWKFIPNVVLSSVYKLPCGISVPSIALGTMHMSKRIATDVVSKALQSGVKAIDTAPTYKNEGEIGDALSKSGKNNFVIVKVPKRATQSESVHQELNASLEKLRREAADLLLLHWPCDVFEAGTIKTVWQAMEQCVADNKCRALGVCNFNIDALRQLLPLCTIPPAVNQVERHPLLPQIELLNFCSNHAILVQAHTPLGQGNILEHVTIAQIAQQSGLTPCQVLLKWNLQQGVVVVPKCTSEEHITEALSVLRSNTNPLTPKHMKMLDEIKTRTRYVLPPFMSIPGKVYSWKD